MNIVNDSLAHALLLEHAAAAKCHPCVISGQPAQARTRETQVRLAATRELHDYWNLLRGERRAPERSEIDPGAIRGVLSDTFVLEVDKLRRYPIRIAGTRTSSLFGRELKGSAFLDLWQTADRQEVAAILASVANEAVAMLAGVSASPDGWKPIDFELLLLPLRHHGDTQARMLGAFSPASTPNWIGLAPSGPLRLLSLRVLARAESAPGKRYWADRDEPAEAADFGRAHQADRRGHLFVFTNTAHQR